MAEAAKQATSDVAEQVKSKAADAGDAIDLMKSKTAEAANNMSSKAHDAIVNGDTAQDIAKKGKELVDGAAGTVQDAVAGYQEGFNEKKQQLKAVAAGDDSSES